MPTYGTGVRNYLTRSWVRLCLEGEPVSCSLGQATCCKLQDSLKFAA